MARFRTSSTLDDVAPLGAALALGYDIAMKNYFFNLSWVYKLYHWSGPTRPWVSLHRVGFITPCGLRSTFVLRATTSNRVQKGCAQGRQISIEYKSKHSACRAASSVSQCLLRLSKCPEQSMRAIYLMWKVVIKRANASCTTPHQGLNPNKRFTLRIVSVAAGLSVFRSISFVQRDWFH